LQAKALKQQNDTRFTFLNALRRILYGAWSACENFTLPTELALGIWTETENRS
jgi:hypothetical protein